MAPLRLSECFALCASELSSVRFLIALSRFFRLLPTSYAIRFQSVFTLRKIGLRVMPTYTRASSIIRRTIDSTSPASPSICASG
jgi:hypothetical protein